VEQKVVLVFVVLVSVWAHVWIFIWLRFKVEEACIIRYLKDRQPCGHASFSELAPAVKLNEKNIRRICRKSKELELAHEACFLKNSA
jgi:hypothetical protein